MATRFEGLTDDQIDLLKRTVCRGASNDELRLFIETANRLGLDPFSKQIHAVKRWTKGGEVLSIQVGVDGFRLQAQRTGQYEGQLGPQWCGADLAWKDVWLSAEPPAAARVGVWRTGFREPIWAVATWEQYKQEGRNGLSPMWQKMGALMLGKCAEALALRRAFPAELSGVYEPSELAQASNDAPQLAPTYTAPALEAPPSPKGAHRAVGPVADESAATVTSSATTAEAPSGTDHGEADVTPDDPTDLVTVSVFRKDSGAAKNHDVTGEWVPLSEQQPRRTAAQNDRLHALKTELGIPDAAWKSRISDLFGVSSSRDLSIEQASELIEKLEARRARYGNAADKAARQARALERAQAEMQQAIAEDEARI